MNPPDPPAFGYFASPTGTATSDGSIDDPWDLQTALDGGYPANTIVAGDTIWLRGGTYTGQFACTLSGSAGNPITFRGYPGERATIDGNYDPDVTGNANPTVWLEATGAYVYLRDLEIMNSNTFNSRVCSPDLSDKRGSDVSMLMPHSKLINCVLHDGGMGVENFASGPATEINGCLVYYEGEYAPYCEQDQAASIELLDNGTAVALSGTASKVDDPAAISPATLTFSHDHTGNYLVVGGYVSYDSEGLYTDLSATYDGVSMTLINGTNYQGDYTGSGPTTVFGLATTNTGVHDVVITYSNAGHAIRGIAQSFSNVASASAGGTWAANRWDATPLSAATSSSSNHLVVDVIGIGNNYWEVQDYAPYGDNAGHLIGGAVGGLNPVVRMSWAAGAATVNMGWNWSRMLYHHGHGQYTQEGVGTGGIETVNGDNTVTIDSGSPNYSNSWAAKNVGAYIILYGAGPAGADLKTTITSFTNDFSIEVADAPSMTLTEATADWFHGKLVKDSIWMDMVTLGSQFYGSSGARFMGSTVEGNLWVDSGVVFGGLGGFLLTDSVFTENYFWNGGMNFGYTMDHMTNVEATRNYFESSIYVPPEEAKWDDMVIGSVGNENTIIGPPENFTSSDFPDNNFYDGPPYPTTNVVVVRDNDYETNRANIYVYNWENLTSVAVDLSGVVANGTSIYIMNAQDYYNTPAWSGTYSGGTVSLPMTGLTKADGIGYTEQPWTGQSFNCFVVRAQSEETWRLS